MNRIFLNSGEPENRGDKKTKNKKKIDFNLYKKNTINSINEVEHFLNNFNHFTKYLKLYKIIKK